MSNLERNIYIYWVGKEYKLISILRNLMYLHSGNGRGYTVNLITKDNVGKYVKDIPSYFERLCPAHQADYVRVNVICDYGGIWLDSDTLVIDSLDTLFDLVEEQEGFFIKENNNILCNGVFGSKKDTPLMNEWKGAMRRILDKKGKNIAWSEVGCQLLQSMYETNEALYSGYKVFEGLDTMYPVNWNGCVHEFLKKPYDNYKNLIRSYQPLVVLVNSVYKELECKSEKEILDSNMPLNYFIHKSFETNRKIVFLKIAKNAGTKVVDLFRKSNYGHVESFFEDDHNGQQFYASKIITLGHQPNIASFKKNYFKLFNCAHKLIVIREPIERLVSSYNYLKCVKPYAFYLNRIDTDGPDHSGRKNYNFHYVHFETTQLKAIDYNESTYNEERFNYIDFGSLTKQLMSFCERVGLNIEVGDNRINVTKNKKHYPNEKELALARCKFVTDLEFYENAFVSKFQTQEQSNRMALSSYKELVESTDFGHKLGILNGSLRVALEKSNVEPKLIGNLFYDHAQTNPPFYDSPLYQDGCEEKRVRFVKACIASRTLFEIGLNGGHSAFLAMMANPELAVCSNDIAKFYPPCPDIHPEIYVPVAAHTLKTLFGERFRFLKGSCLTVVPWFAKSNPDALFDIVHIDGHKATYEQDFENLRPMLADKALVVFDDTQQKPVQQLVDRLLATGKLHRSPDFPQMDPNYNYRNEILVYSK